MRCFLLAVLALALASPAAGQVSRRELSRRGGYQPQYISIPPKKKEESRPVVQPVDEEAKLQKTLAVMRRAPIAGNIHPGHKRYERWIELASAAKARERERDQERQERINDYFDTMLPIYQQQQAAAAERAAIEAEARAEVARIMLPVVLDHYLRQQYPQRHEVYHYDTSPRPGEWYYDGVVIRRAR